MAKYDYQCKDCQTWQEVERSIHEDEVAVACPECAQDMKRVYGAVGAVFKGTGFYRTDKEPQNINFYPENGATF